MESLHPDDDSPPPHLVNTAEDRLLQSSRGDDDDTEYTECPVDGCGELLTNEMIDFHAEMHGAEDSSSNLNLHGKAAGPAEHLETRGASSSGPSRSHREADRHRRAKAEGPSSSKHPKLSLRSFFRMPDYFAHHHHHDSASKSRNKAGEKTGKSSATSGVSAGLRRLGVSADSSALSCRKYLLTSNSSLQKSQLGQHANEDRMPDSLVSLLKTGVGYHHLEGVVPVVAQLLQQSAATRHAYLCHPWVQHISKLRKEGMLRSSIGLPYCVSLWLNLPQVVSVGTATSRCSVRTSSASSLRGTTELTAAYRPSFRSRTTSSRPGMLASTHRAVSRRAGSRGRESISGPPRFVFLSYGE